MNNIENNIVKYLINDKYTVVINLPSSKLNDNRNIKKYCRKRELNRTPYNDDSTS